MGEAALAVRDGDESPSRSGGTVYMRMWNGQSAIQERPITVKKEEYVQIVDKFYDVLYSKPFWVPNSHQLEKIVVLMFVRSGKLMSCPVKTFICGKGSLTLYRFKGTEVIVQRFFGKRFARITFSRKTDRWMRLSVVHELLAEFRPLRTYLSGMRDEDLHMLSEMWRDYVVSGKRDQFRFWMKKHELYHLFKRRLSMHRKRF